MEPNSSIYTAAVPGTCGELVQGWSADWNEPVLVSCPVALFNRVSIELTAGPDILLPTVSGSYHKLRKAARLLLNYLGRPDLGAQVYLNSQLQPGKGMASSTADVVGVMVGLATALGHAISPGELAQLACQVEPSDSTMFANLTMLAYRGSAQYLELGPAPTLPLLMLDTGQAVDTLTYNARLNLAAVRGLAQNTAEAVKTLKLGLVSNDAELIGAAATLSALSYQTVNHNPLIDQAVQWASEMSAAGLVRAHSGSVAGLLYPANTDLTDLEQWLKTRFKGRIWQTYLTRGSCLLVDEPPLAQLMEVSAVL